mgnify:CR=1 FL=1|jgi:hypothetical protein
MKRVKLFQPLTSVYSELDADYTIFLASLVSMLPSSIMKVLVKNYLSARNLIAGISSLAT